MIPLYNNNSTRSKPFLTSFIIGICLFVFVWQKYLYAGSIPIVQAFGFISVELFLDTLNSLLDVLTSMFLHDDWSHLLGNILYLWVFGKNVEGAIGHSRFFIFYLLCGAITMLAHAFAYADSTIPIIGASGAISAVLGAYLVLFPSSNIRVAVPFGLYLHTFSTKATWVLGFWFVIQLINSFAAAVNSSVAWYVHIVGFLLGMLLIPLFKKKKYRMFSNLK